MKAFTFTVDDNIRFLKELSHELAESIFCHPYMALYKKLHEKYGVKIQLNLFYRCDGFTLSDMTDRYKDEWEENSDWLKLSFHSDFENVTPYKDSGYSEVFDHCQAVHREILRFAGEKSLGKTTTIHYCSTTRDGILALRDCGIKGLLGLYDDGRISYSLTPEDCLEIGLGKCLERDGIHHLPIDIVLNSFGIPVILEKLEKLLSRDTIELMIHEQFFYPDYRFYQPHFEEKLDKTFAFFKENNYESKFMEEII